MKLQNAFLILSELRTAFQIAAWPTFMAIVNNPLLLLHPVEIRRVFMAHVWMLYGPGMDEGLQSLKENLVKPNACGTVLDIGAGEYFRHFYDPKLRMISRFVPPSSPGLPQDMDTRSNTSIPPKSQNTSP